MQRRIPLVSPSNRSPPFVVAGALTASHSSVQHSTMSESPSAYHAIDSLIKHVTRERERLQLRRTLTRYVRLFDVMKSTIASMLKFHEIKILHYPPPAQKAYYSTPIKQPAMDKIVGELMEAGLIRPSSSPYAAPVLLVAKKDASWRMVVDYKKLNGITIKVITHCHTWSKRFRC